MDDANNFHNSLRGLVKYHVLPGNGMSETGANIMAGRTKGRVLGKLVAFFVNGIQYTVSRIWVDPGYESPYVNEVNSSFSGADEM